MLPLQHQPHLRSQSGLGDRTEQLEALDEGSRGGEVRRGGRLATVAAGGEREELLLERAYLGRDRGGGRSSGSGNLGHGRSLPTIVVAWEVVVSAELRDAAAREWCRHGQR